MRRPIPMLNNPKGLRVDSPRGEAEWAIDPWPLRAKGLIVLVGTLSDRRRRPDDGNWKRDISFETALRMYKTL